MTFCLIDEILEHAIPHSSEKNRYADRETDNVRSHNIHIKDLIIQLYTYRNLFSFKQTHVI